MKPSQKPGVQFRDGIPLSVPNTTYDGDGFFISHNDRDAGVYGDVTTALVVGSKDSTAFYILNGDHRAGYLPLIPQGLQACLAYFRQHMDQMNKFSEAPPAFAGLAGDVSGSGREELEPDSLDEPRADSRQTPSPRG